MILVSTQANLLEVPYLLSSRVEVLRLYLNPRIGAESLQNIRRSASVRRIAPSSVVQPVRHASRLTDQDVAQLAEGYRSGRSAKALSKQFAIHRHTVAEVFRRAAIEPRTRGLTPDQVQLASRLYRGGLSLAKVGGELGVTANTVRRYSLLEGVVMRSPHERIANQRS